jgi:predicted AlkP superfamily pyrophosphatase or phosphodiesterase
MKKVLAAALSLGLIGTTLPAPVQANDDWGGQSKIRHVLLISIDGMHVVDYLNCSKGISTVNNGAPYCPNLAELSENGVSYRDTSTSKPSDSFPGLTAIVTGALPRTTGVYYDVAYDRVYAPPTITTGNGLGQGPCTPNQANGTTSEYEEGIDKNQQYVNGIDGISTANGDGGINSIDPQKLIRDPFNGCAPVYPWDFVRTNSIFSVIHYAGGYVAWSDKHPAYSSVAGHGTGGKTLDDFYGPEINSVPVGLPGVTAGTVSCNPLPDQTAVAQSNAWTDSFQNIQCYDQLKVNAVLNWINGKTHNGSKNAPRPNLFGMNFQTVSVGQKLIEKQLSLSGGYLDSTGTPSPSLLGEIEFTDAAIGSFVQALKKNGIYDSTLIIITAKHGQSPIDSARYLGISNSTGDPITTSPATILDMSGGPTSCLPFSESPSNPTGIGPTEDDVSLIWLSSNCTTDSAVALLRSTSPTTNNIAGIGEIFSDSIITTYFNKPGIPPHGDSRTPDIVVTPNIGVTYSGSTKKLAEHGGFSRDDTNVMILVSNPSLHAKTVTTTVGTVQIAPTILKALGLNPSALDGVRIEGTESLPGLPF